MWELRNLVEIHSRLMRGIGCNRRGEWVCGRAANIIRIYGRGGNRFAILEFTRDVPFLLTLGAFVHESYDARAACLACD